MSDKGKVSHKKKFLAPREHNLGRIIFNSKAELLSSQKEKEQQKDSSQNSEGSTSKRQPTILLKARDPNAEETTTIKISSNKSENDLSSSSAKNQDQEPTVVKNMTKSEKFLDEGAICSENIQEYLEENPDFLVVALVGSHGVGKSTILNYLAQDQNSSILKKYGFKSNSADMLSEELGNLDLDKKFDNTPEIFKVEKVEHLESNTNATFGIDIYISSNRVIFLDTQPLTSISIMDEYFKNDTKRPNINDFVSLESGEIQGLQICSFLMAVCHVLVLVQDYFLDSNIIRFIQTAEMLKPTMSNPEEGHRDHFPNLLLLQNRSLMEDFTPSRFSTMQEIYLKMFQKSRLNIETDLGLGNGTLITNLNEKNCGSPINLYLIPEIAPFDDTSYNGHPSIDDLIKKLRSNIFAHPFGYDLTHVMLTEKTWLTYCCKVWENVKKSSFFVEYAKLLP